MSTNRRTPPHAFTLVRVTPKGRARLLREVADEAPPVRGQSLAITRRPGTGTRAGKIDVKVGRSASDFLKVPDSPVDGEPMPSATLDTDASAAADPAEPDFARELNLRLDLARQRTDAESAHLDQVGAVAADYIPGPPRLRLIR